MAAASEQTVLYVDKRNVLHSFDINNGDDIWSLILKDEIVCEFAMNSNCVIVGSKQGLIQCFDQTSSRLRWQCRTDGNATGFAVDRERLFITNTIGGVEGRNMDDGSLAWKAMTYGAISKSPSIVRWICRRNGNWGRP